MTHTQSNRTFIGNLFKMAGIITVFAVACNTETNTQPDYHTFQKDDTAIIKIGNIQCAGIVRSTRIVDNWQQLYIAFFKFPVYNGWYSSINVNPWSPSFDVVDSKATTRVYLDIDPNEARGMSTDSLHPDAALMYRGKDGVPHVSYNYSK